jgi:hypothetical protein
MTGRWDESELGDLLAALPRPPAAWTEAAASIPALDVAIEQLRLLAGADADLRQEEIDELERLLAERGVEPTPQLRAAIRHRLQGTG